MSKKKSTKITGKLVTSSKAIEETTFYMYRWENGYTTFVIAKTSDEAIERIKKNREAACPPELHDEKILKKRLTKAHPSFILTVGTGPDGPEEEIQEKESLN